MQVEVGGEYGEAKVFRVNAIFTSSRQEVKVCYTSLGVGKESGNRICLLTEFESLVLSFNS